MKPLNYAEVLMWHQIKELRGDIRWAKEYRFHPVRRWRFDFCLWKKDSGVTVSWWAIEIDGGTWIQGRHTRGSGQAKDNEKFNEAARLGWRILKFTPQQVLKGEAIAFIKRVLES